MADQKVLVIDDNPINLKLVRVLLAGEGFEVHTAEDAESAIALLETLHPRLILMDLQLPGMDGLQLTRQLKEGVTTRDIQIVALTSYAMKGDREKALSAGCDEYLTKPIDTRTLPGLVARLLADPAPAPLARASVVTTDGSG